MPLRDEILATTKLAASSDETADKDIQVQISTAVDQNMNSKSADAPRKLADKSNIGRSRFIETKSSRKHLKKWRSAEKQLRKLRSKKHATASSKKAVKIAAKFTKARPSTFLRKRCREPGCGAPTGRVSSLPGAWQVS
jgi:hypothetical protein